MRTAHFRRVAAPPLQHRGEAAGAAGGLPGFEASSGRHDKVRRLAPPALHSLPYATFMKPSHHSSGGRRRRRRMMRRSVAETSRLPHSLATRP